MATGLPRRRDRQRFAGHQSGDRDHPHQPRFRPVRAECRT